MTNDPDRSPAAVPAAHPPTTTVPAPDPVARRRAIVAGSVGNFIEWYEFGIYGFFATIIAAHFFSASDQSGLHALIATYASFAIGFFFRPIGAALFGRIGDRIGRRPTLVIVLVTMSVATALIGCLPTHAAIGMAAPILLTLVRIIQGLSAGGEFGGAVSVMTEFAPGAASTAPGSPSPWRSACWSEQAPRRCSRRFSARTPSPPGAGGSASWSPCRSGPSPSGCDCDWRRHRLSRRPAPLAAPTPASLPRVAPMPTAQPSAPSRPLARGSERPCVRSAAGSLD
ncbi:MFS transporter [Brachybacterium endophyticum]|uniref:MFS transporter n=1 Tax=Brachybacterium endophyticum TaxID=2182385 RepID=UPI00196A219A|nr:MFS transporter [Brachybacterium endophyticum]